MLRARLLLSLAVLLVAAPTAHATVILTVDVSNAVVPVGGTTTVEVRATLSNPVLGFGIDLVFDPLLLSAGTVTIGPSWTPLGSADGDGLAGFNGLGVVGSDVLLASIVFTGLAEGFDTIGTAATPGDLTEGFPLLPSGFDGDVLFGSEQIQVPEPAVATLLALVLACAPVRRSR